MRSRTFDYEKEGLDANGVSNLLNKKSGVMGIFGESSDMRDLENAVAAGNPRAILAEKMYFYRIKKYIALMPPLWVVVISWFGPVVSARTNGRPVVRFVRHGIHGHEDRCREERGHAWRGDGNQHSGQ